MSCLCKFDRSLGVLAMCEEHWDLLEQESLSEPHPILALAAVVRRLGLIGKA